MPATFLIYLAAALLALLAPVVAIGSLALMSSAKWRPIARRVLLWSSIGAFTFISAWFGIVAILGGSQKIELMSALAVFGAGFSVGALALGGLHIVRRVLSNSSMQPTDRQRPAAD